MSIEYSCSKLSIQSTFTRSGGCILTLALSHEISAVSNRISIPRACIKSLPMIISWLLDAWWDLSTYGLQLMFLFLWNAGRVNSISHLLVVLKLPDFVDHLVDLSSVF